MTRVALCIMAVLAAGTTARAAFCPSYTASSSSNTHMCGVESAAGANPSIADWQGYIETACAGPGGSAWGTGPTIPTLGQGCGGTTTKVPAHFPCELVEAIAMQETGWIQFCVPTTPADQVGLPSRTIISFDCGYGVAQVTTGMHVGETADWDRDRVASDPQYALEVGLEILGQKWSATSCVGDNQPGIVEDWYLAAWAYNGLSYSNNPNNPNFDAARPACDPNVSCAGRPYQERIWGWMEHPPSDGRWAALKPAYPDPSEIPSSSGVKIPNLAEPHCASATDCTTTRAVHMTRCQGTPPGSDLASVSDASVAGDAGTTVDQGGCGCDLGRRASTTPAIACALLVSFWLWSRRRRTP